MHRHFAENGVRAVQYRLNRPTGVCPVGQPLRSTANRGSDLEEVGTTDASRGVRPRQAPEERSLCVFDTQICIVAEQEDLNWQAVMNNRLQFLEVQHDGAIASDENYSLLVLSEASSDGAGQSKAH